MKNTNCIGIDPGTITGCAVWDVEKKEFESIFSGRILEVISKIEIYTVFGNNTFFIENPNLRKWYGKNSYSKLQGAGSIKRDYSIWVEWFTANNCKFIQLDPKHLNTKLPSLNFQKITGWKGKTNEHSRDAAMMVFNRK